MTRIAQAARITLKGFHKRGVTSDSNIEDQCELVYQAAKHFAQQNNFEPETHRGKAGMRGHLVMSQIVRGLFPDLSGDELKIRNGIINQVLRRTDAAVCLKHGVEGETPEWFIASSMPKNITVVALALKGRSAEVNAGSANGGRFDENKFLTREERRLAPEEVGESQPPNEVTVKGKTKKSTTTKKTTPPALPPHKQRFVDLAAARTAEHQAFIERVFEEIQTNPVPCTTKDLHRLLAEETGHSSDTTFAAAIRELLESGRIVSRKETDAESIVRGGGRPPKATRPFLYAVAPGPVPVRDRLPSGVTAGKSAYDLAQEAKAERADAEQARAELGAKILESLEVHGMRLKRIRDEFKLSEEEAVEVLAQLMADGLVYRGVDKAYYHHTKRRTAAVNSNVRPSTWPGSGEPAQEPDQPVAALTGVVQPPPALTGEANPYMERLIGYAETLVNHQNAGGSERIKELEAELSKARETIDHLRAALGNLSS